MVSFRPHVAPSYHRYQLELQIYSRVGATYINNSEDNDQDREIPDLGLPYPCGQLVYVKPGLTLVPP